MAAIVLTTIVAFAPGADNEFVYWDDENNLRFNAHIRSFSAENLEWMWRSSLLGVWQPLTWMITAAEYQVFGADGMARFSRGMHRASIGLHAVAAVLAFFVVRRLIALGAPETAAGSPVGLSVGAAVAGLLFAVHPLRCEIVSWASGQPYALAMIPALATVWCYLRAHEAGRLCWHGAALSCLAVSLLCKAMAVPLVAVLLVLDVYPLRRVGGRQRWGPSAVLRVIIEKVSYAVVTLVVLGLTVWATISTKSYTPDPAFKKLLIASFCMLFYVSMTFVPYRLAPYYQRPSPFDTGDPWFVGAALAFVAVTIVLIVMRRRRPWLLATWSAYVLVLLPVVGLVKHGGQMAADRYAYLSCIGWAALAGAGVLRIWARSAPSARAVRQAITLVVAIAAVFGLTWMSRSYCLVWKNSETLWTAMVDRNPRFWMGYYNLAKANKRPCRKLRERAEQAEEEGDTETAARLRQERDDRFRAAAANYRRAIELYPAYPEAHVDLGNMLKAGTAPGGLAAAEEHYRAALKGRPGFHMAHWNLGSLMMRVKRYDEAVKHLELAEVDAERAGETKHLPGIRRALERARAKLNGP